jgi:hypothetical protein
MNDSGKVMNNRLRGTRRCGRRHGADFLNRDCRYERD